MMTAKSERTRRFRAPAGGALLSAAMLVLASCAPVTLYSIDLKYEPSKNVSRVEHVAKKIGITVAVFNDERQQEDRILIGRIVKTDGSSIPVVPKFKKPPESVTAVIKDFLSGSGYRVAKGAPAWNLREDAIRPDWGKILIGGTIDELDVVCREALPLNKCEAKVKLTVLYADVKKKFVFHRTTVESQWSQEALRLSEEEVAQQLSGALSEAVEKIFDGPSLKKKVQDMLNKAS